MEHLRGALAVRIDTEMGEHDALGFAGAAAAEDDRGQAVGSQGDRLSAGSLDEAARSEQGQERRDCFLAGADRPGYVLQSNHSRPIRQFELGFLDEGAARENRAQVCQAHRGFQAGFADRVVQVHDGFVAEGRGDID